MTGRKQPTRRGRAGRERLPLAGRLVALAVVALLGLALYGASTALPLAAADPAARPSDRPGPASEPDDDATRGCEVLVALVPGSAEAAACQAQDAGAARATATVRPKGATQLPPLPQEPLPPTRAVLPLVPPPTRAPGAAPQPPPAPAPAARPVPLLEAPTAPAVPVVSEELP